MLMSIRNWTVQVQGRWTAASPSAQTDFKLSAPWKCDGLVEISSVYELAENDKISSLLGNSLRACSWRSEFTIHTDILVNMGEINALDRKFSPLAPSVRALELN